MHQLAPTETGFTFLVILRTWQNMIWKAFLLFGGLCSFRQFAVYMRQNGSDRYFFHFLLIVGIKGEKGSLAHDKTWFGRRFYVSVVW